jgi:hypothetical protein
MATEEAKKNNQMQLMRLMLTGYTLGIWELVAESANTLSPIIGKQVLGMVEKQLGLEIAGEKPEDALTELGRIFVDEFGLGTEAKVVRTDKTIKASFKNASGVKEMAMMAQTGMTPFGNPFLCTGLACLNRLGLKARADIETDVPNNVLTVVFDLL